MSPDARAPYLHLIELIERDLALAGAGRFEELVAANSEREAFVRTLPPTPPPQARDLLERASLIQQRLKIELLRGRDELMHKTAQVERGRQTARGYTPARPRVPRIAESA